VCTQAIIDVALLKKEAESITKDNRDGKAGVKAEHESNAQFMQDESVKRMYATALTHRRPPRARP